MIHPRTGIRNLLVVGECPRSYDGPQIQLPSFPARNKKANLVVGLPLSPRIPRTLEMHKEAVNTTFSLYAQYNITLGKDKAELLYGAYQERNMAGVTSQTPEMGLAVGPLIRNRNARESVTPPSRVEAEKILMVYDDEHLRIKIE